MADELGAVLDAPEVDAVVDDVVDPAEEVTDVVDPAVVVDAKEIKGDERTLPQWVKNLKAQDPAAFREAKDTFFANKAWNDKTKDFDLDGTKGWLEEHGGKDAIVATLGELQTKAQQFDGLMTKIEEGNREVLADIPPEALAKLAPAVAEQWATADPEGWTAAMSAVMANTIAQNGIPLFLDRMELMFEVGKTDQIPAMIKQMKEWAGSFQAKAAAPRATPGTTQPNKIDAREQALNQREEQAFTNDMKRDVDSFRSPLISKELDSFFKRRPNDTEAKDLAISTVRAQVIERMSNDAAFQKSLNALTARKDREGAMRLIKSRETAAITEIAPKVGRTIFGNPQVAKAEDKKVATRAAATVPATARSADKFDAIWSSR